MLDDRRLDVRRLDVGGLDIGGLDINVVKLREYSLGVSLFARLLTQDAVAARIASDISSGLWPKESTPAKNISAITILNFLTMLTMKVS